MMERVKRIELLIPAGVAVNLAEKLVCLAQYIFGVEITACEVKAVNRHPVMVCDFVPVERKPAPYEEYGTWGRPH